MKPAGVERPGQRGTHSRARCLPTIPAPARPEQPPRTPPLARHAGGKKDRRKRRQPRRPERIVGGAAAPRPVLVPRGTLGGRDQVRNAPSLILRRALPRGGGPCCIGKACGTGRRLGSPRLDAGEQAERDEGDAPAADAGCALQLRCRSAPDTTPMAVLMRSTELFDCAPGVAVRCALHQARWSRARNNVGAWWRARARPAPGQRTDPRRCSDCQELTLRITNNRSTLRIAPSGFMLRPRQQRRPDPCCSPPHARSINRQASRSSSVRDRPEASARTGLGTHHASPPVRCSAALSL